MTITAQTCAGTLRWMAPELFKDGSRPSKASDIYAFGMVAYEVRPHCILWKTNPDDRSCRFSHTRYRSHRSPPTLSLDGSSMVNGPHGRQTERSLVSRTRSGCSWRIVGMGTRPSGQMLQTSCPPLKRLPAIGSPLPRKRSRVLVSAVQSLFEDLRRGDRPIWSWLIALERNIVSIACCIFCGLRFFRNCCGLYLILPIPQITPVNTSV